MKPFPSFENYFASFNADSVIILWLSCCCYLVAESTRTLCDLYPTKLLCPWNSPGKNSGIHHHSILQGIFLTQGLNSGLQHCGQILYHLSHRRELNHINNEMKPPFNFHIYVFVHKIENEKGELILFHID